MDEIDILFDKYYELFPIQTHVKVENECKHKETTSDDSHYYVVCISCGQCIDYANIQHIEFEYLQNATVTRIYKKTNYLNKSKKRNDKDIVYLLFCSTISWSIVLKII